MGWLNSIQPTPLHLPRAGPLGSAAIRAAPLPFHARVANGQLNGHLIEVLMLEALVAHAKGDKRQTFTRLEEAFTLAERRNGWSWRRRR